MMVAMKLREGMIAKFPEIIQEKIDNREIHVIEILDPKGNSVRDFSIPMNAIAEIPDLSTMVISGLGASSRFFDYGYGNFRISCELDLGMFHKFWILFRGDINDDDLSILSNDESWQVDEVY